MPIRITKEMRKDIVLMMNTEKTIGKFLSNKKAWKAVMDRWGKTIS